MNSFRTPSIGEAPYRPKQDYKATRTLLQEAVSRLNQKASKRVKVWKEEK